MCAAADPRRTSLRLPYHHKKLCPPPFQLTLSVPADKITADGGALGQVFSSLSHQMPLDFLKWDLLVIRGGVNVGFGFVLQCGNQWKKDKEWKCTVDYKFTMWKNATQNDRLDNFCCEKKDVTFSPKSKNSAAAIMLLSELVKVENEWVRDNVILLTVDMYPKSIVGPHYVSKMNLVEEREGSATRKVLKFLESGQGCDVTFKTKDDTEVKAHKFILMDGSPVFKAMFESGMSETKSREIKVEDIDDETMRELLKLMYSDDPTPIELMPPKLLKKLLYAAEKYELDWIKSYCGYILSESCDVETAPSLHKLAKRYRLEELEKEVTDFASANFAEIWSTVTDQLAESDSE